MRRFAGVVTIALLALGIGVAPAAAHRSFAWSAGQVVDPARGGFLDVSCVSATWCRAAGAHGAVWQYDGRSWTPGPRFSHAPTAAVTSIECVSTTFCVADLSFADGSGRFEMFDGRQWRAFAGSRAEAGRISCNDRRFCLFVSGERNGYRRWNGTSWSPLANLPTQGDAGGVSCWATDRCRAFTLQGEVLDWDGTGWSAGRLPLNDVFGLDCPSGDRCVAVNWSGRVSVYRSGRWSPVRRVASSALLGIECPSTSYCVALSDDGHSLVYYADRDRWTEPASIAAGENLVAFSCPSAGSCHAVTREGSVLSRSPGGWSRPQRVNASAGHPSDVSCTSATQCVLVDGDGNAEEFDGASWSAPRRLVDTSDGLAKVSCPTTSFCAVGTYNGSVLFRRDGQWSAPTPVLGEALTGLSCVSGTLCVAVGLDGGADDASVAAVWNGSTWRTHVFDTRQTPFGVSCAPGLCLAAFVDGAVRAFDGTTWSAADPAGLATVAYGVSCVDSTYCIVVGRDRASHVALRYDGAAWLDTHAPANVPALNVSCASTSVCVSTEGRSAAAFDGSRWSTARRVTSAGNLTGISCSTTRCVAVDGRGYVYVGSG